MTASTPPVPGAIYCTKMTTSAVSSAVEKANSTRNIHETDNYQETDMITTTPKAAPNHSKKRERDGEEEPYQELKWNDALPLFQNHPGSALLHQEWVEEKKILPIHAGRTALLVVDVQPEYWSQSPAVRQDFPDFPQRMRQLVAHCRKQKCKIIWVRADYRYAHSPWLAQFARLHQGRIPSEVFIDPDNMPDQDGVWEDFATPEGGEYVIPKTSWSSTRHTALMDLLKQSGIDTVLVCGLITSVCVQHSAFGIFEAGYRTLLVTDACADRGRARHDAALALYGDYMYELLTVQDLVEPQNPFYLRPAQPVWLTRESVDNLVQPQFFNALQDSVVTTLNKSGGATAVSSNSSSSSSVAMDQTANRTTLGHKRPKLVVDEHAIIFKVQDNGVDVVKTTNVVVDESDNTTKNESNPSGDNSMAHSTARSSTSSLTTLAAPIHDPTSTVIQV